MIGTIRKHSTVLWLIIIAAIIVTFVYWGANPGRYNDSSRPDNLGSINGKRVTAEQFYQARNEMHLRFYFSYQDWPDRNAEQLGFNIMRETYSWLLLIRKAEELGIHVGGDAVASTANYLLRNFNRGNPVPLEAFVNSVLRPHGLTVEDFERFVRHDLAIQQLINSVGAGGKLVTPAEVQSLYERENQEVSTYAVFFSASNYLDSVSVTPEAVAQFYTNQAAQYRLPDRLQVSYVQFPFSNFMTQATAEVAKITNFNEIVEAKYEQFGTNYFPGKTAGEAKEEIRKLMLEEQASRLATKAAEEFTRTLYDMKPSQPGNLAALATKEGLTAEVTAPFSRENPPAKLNVAETFTTAAFSLNADEPSNGPIAGHDAAYVIEMKSALPSTLPSLDEIRDRVTGDFKYVQAIAQARQACLRFNEGLTNLLAQNKTFTEACSAVKQHPVLVTPFSLSTRSLPEVETHVALNDFKRVVFSTELGHINLSPSREGAFVVYPQSKLPIDTARMQQELPRFTANVRQARLNEAFQVWFRQESERGLRYTPAANVQQQSAPDTLEN